MIHRIIVYSVSNRSLDYGVLLQKVRKCSNVSNYVYISIKLVLITSSLLSSCARLPFQSRSRVKRDILSPQSSCSHALIFLVLYFLSAEVRTEH